jgi:hypothetical protein
MTLTPEISHRLLKSAEELKEKLRLKHWKRYF